MPHKKVENDLETNDELNKIQRIIDRDYYAVDQQRDWSNEDIRFVDVDGAMYEDWFREELFDDRPKMEFNKVAQSVHRFLGEWASNRFQTKFIPDDGITSEADAELLSGLYRKDFRRSSGAEAIDNAVQEMAKGGYSALRLSTEFIDEEDIDNDKQRVIFEPIFSGYNSTIFDANAKKYDKSDARHVTYLEQMTREAAEEEWGEKISSAFQPPSQRRFNWNNVAHVWIGHFYEIREKKETVIVFEDPLGRRKSIYEKDFKPFLKELADGGYEEISKRKKIRRTVWKTIIGGTSILEEAVRIPGKLLPIIPMYGYRSYVDGKEFWYGIVRKNKDANRLFNMAATSIAEAAATTSKSIPIFTDEQVEGRESALSEMHLGKYNYTIINQLYDESGNMIPAGPVGMWPASPVDPNNAAVMQIASEYIQSETGGAPQDILDPHASGKAINAITARVDMNTAVLMDNISKTLKRVGEVYRSIAGEIYDVEQKINLIKEDGTESAAVLFELITDEETGRTKAINDITTGVYEVIVDTGSSFASKRRETMQDMKDIMTITPPESPYMPFLYAEWIAALDGPDLAGLKEFNSGKMLEMGLRKPENEEEVALLQQQQEAQTNEQGEYLQALAAESNANAQESLSNIEKNSSVAQLNAAKTAETLNGINIDRFKAANEGINTRTKAIEARAKLSQGFIR